MALKPNGSVGGFLAMPLVAGVGVLVGCWWWARGWPLFGGQPRGASWVAVVAVRVGVLAAAGWAMESGPRYDVGWWCGFAVAVVCGAAGWWTWLTREGTRRPVSG